MTALSCTWRSSKKHLADRAVPHMSQSPFCTPIHNLSRRIRWPLGYTGRVLRNRHAETWFGREGELEANIDEVSREYASARERGDFDVAAVIAGEAAGLIHDIPPAAEIVERIVGEAEDRLRSHQPADELL